MISYTPAVVFGLLRGELVMMRSQQSKLNLAFSQNSGNHFDNEFKRNLLRNNTADLNLSLVAQDLHCYRRFLFFETSIYFLFAALLNEKCVVCCERKEAPITS